MKRFIIAALAALLSLTCFAQSNLNSNADSILGEYESVQGGDPYKVRVTKNGDGTYKAQIFWCRDDKDAAGNKKLDVKNPDKSLRNVPSDRIVLFNGLSYNSAKKVWDGTKIYDPQRGIKANVTAEFLADGRLQLKGTIMGIGEKVYWTPLKK